MGRYSIFLWKTTSITYFTEASCANTIYKNKNGYEVLSSLGHGEGSTSTKIVKNPRELTLAKKNEINSRYKGSALGYKDKSNNYELKLDVFGMEFLSKINFNNKDFYIVNNPPITFLAELNNNKLEIVNPLFYDEFNSHYPITCEYGDNILINIFAQEYGKDYEESIILINGNKITKLDWNKIHKY